MIDDSDIRDTEHSDTVEEKPINPNGKTVSIIVLLFCIVGSLMLTTGFIIMNSQLLLGVAIGIFGIIMLLSLISIINRYTKKLYGSL